MKYRLAIFDFDGTLADSLPFLLSSFNRLAEQHGFKQIDLAQAETLRHAALGRLTVPQILRQLELPTWKLPLVAKNFTDLMSRNTGAVPLFSGVDHALRHLAAAGVTLALASSNSRANVDRILGAELAGLIGWCECGMSIFGKAARVRKILKHAGIPAAHAIYIGDLPTDGEAAHQAGVAFGAVAWGYGTPESLQPCRPDLAFERVADLRRIADS